MSSKMAKTLFSLLKIKHGDLVWYTSPQEPEGPGVIFLQILSCIYKYCLFPGVSHAVDKNASMWISLWKKQSKGERQTTWEKGRKKTLPEAQRTQGIDSLTWVISPAKYNATCIGSKFGQLYVVPLVLVQNLTTRWCHQNWFQIWPTCNAISIGSNFGHQVALLALVTNLVTRWRHLH